jgi:Leucine-rich repeat (LRR) protein
MSVEIEIETDEDYLQKQVEAELAEMSDGDDEDVGDWSINWKQRNAEPVPEDGDVSFQEEDEDMREFLESSKRDADRFAPLEVAIGESASSSNIILEKSAEIVHTTGAYINSTSATESLLEGGDHFSLLGTRRDESEPRLNRPELIISSGDVECIPLHRVDFIDHDVRAVVELMVDSVTQSEAIFDVPCPPVVNRRAEAQTFSDDSADILLNRFEIIDTANEDETALENFADDFAVNYVVNDYWSADAMMNSNKELQEQAEKDLNRAKSSQYLQDSEIVKLLDEDKKEREERRQRMESEMMKWTRTRSAIFIQKSIRGLQTKKKFQKMLAKIEKTRLAVHKERIKRREEEERRAMQVADFESKKYEEWITCEIAEEKRMALKNSRKLSADINAVKIRKELEREKAERLLMMQADKLSRGVEDSERISNDVANSFFAEEFLTIVREECANIFKIEKGRATVIDTSKQAKVLDSGQRDHDKEPLSSVPRSSWGGRVTSRNIEVRGGESVETDESGPKLNGVVETGSDQDDNFENRAPIVSVANRNFWKETTSDVIRHNNSLLCFKPSRDGYMSRMIIDGSSEAVDIASTECHGSLISALSYWKLNFWKPDDYIDDTSASNGSNSTENLKSYSSKNLNLNVENLTNLNSLGKVDDLRCLELNVNKLTSTKGIGHLTSLVELSIQDNILEDLEEVNCLVALRVLKLNTNFLSNIDCLWNLKNLTTLTANTNSLDKVPTLVSKQLQRLELYHNKIRQILPSSFSSLANLTHLDLGRNKLTEVDGKDISCCQLLTTLVLSQNSLKSVPQNLHLPLLRCLWLSGNQLTNFDPWKPYTSSYVRHFPMYLPLLEKVYLQDNKICTLTEDVMQLLPSLVFMDISFNEICRVEDISAISFCRQLKSLQIQDNPLTLTLDPTLWLSEVCPSLSELSGLAVSAYRSASMDLTATAEKISHFMNTQRWCDFHGSAELLLDIDGETLTSGEVVEHSTILRNNTNVVRVVVPSTLGALSHDVLPRTHKLTEVIPIPEQVKDDPTTSEFVDFLGTLSFQQNIAKIRDKSVCRNTVETHLEDEITLSKLLILQCKLMHEWCPRDPNKSLCVELAQVCDKTGGNVKRNEGERLQKDSSKESCSDTTNPIDQYISELQPFIELPIVNHSITRIQALYRGYRGRNFVASARQYATYKDDELDEILNAEDAMIFISAGENDLVVNPTQKAVGGGTLPELSEGWLTNTPAGQAFVYGDHRRRKLQSGESTRVVGSPGSPFTEQGQSHSISHASSSTRWISQFPASASAVGIKSAKYFSDELKLSFNAPSRGRPSSQASNMSDASIASVSSRAHSEFGEYGEGESQDNLPISARHIGQLSWNDNEVAVAGDYGTQDQNVLPNVTKRTKKTKNSDISRESSGVRPRYEKFAKNTAPKSNISGISGSFGGKPATYRPKKKGKKTVVPAWLVREDT